MLRTLYELKKIPDFQLKSRNILGGVLIAQCILVFITLLVELAIDLATTPLPALLAFFSVSLLLIALFFMGKENRWIRHMAIVVPYCFFMLIFFTSPMNYHTMGFWLILISLIALILQGIRMALVWFGIVVMTYIFNLFYIESILDGGYQIQVKTVPYAFTHLIFGMGVFASSVLLYKLLVDAYADMKDKTEKLEELQLSISLKKAQLERYQQALLDLNRNELNVNLDISELYKRICRVAARELSTSRVSIWMHNSGKSELVRMYLYEDQLETDEVARLNREDFPVYFESISKKPFILADDAHTHPDTQEFSTTYLSPLNIHSMLDCPILINQEPIGVICCEQKFKPKNWSLEDALFVQSLADFVSLGTQNERIKSMMRQIRNQNHELIEKSNSIETMNEELTALNEELISLNEQLSGMNQGLEMAVKERTEELEIQNKQLTEYAFINSHMLRAPLARVLGISQLVAMEITSIRDKQLIDALQHSSQELDGIVRKISELLYAGNNISREDINSMIQEKFKNLNDAY